MSPLSILVLDDDEMITMLTSTVLSMHGYVVEAFNDPVRALEALASKPFRLVMVDIMMPGIDGVTFLRRAGAMEGARGARFMILSGKKLNEEERREIYDLGAEIMIKPFLPHKLVEQVALVLG